MCKKPEKGLLTILDCPRATRAITFHRSDELEDLSISVPRFILRMIFLKFLANKNEKPIKTNKKMTCSNPIYDGYLTVSFFNSNVVLLPPKSEKVT